MLYFAYGSNLNWYQMKGARCRGSIFLQTYILKGYKLIFSHRNPNNKYGHANIEKNRDFKEELNIQIDEYKTEIEDAQENLKELIIELDDIFDAIKPTSSRRMAAVTS